MIENLENEIWVKHPIYTDFAASNLGRVKSIERDVFKKDGTFLRHQQEKLIKFRLVKDGYLRFKIENKNLGVCESPFAHRFIYEAFYKCILPKGMLELQINHIDEDKTNNCIDNLELCTPQYNVDYSLSKAVGQYTLDGELVKIWKSTNEAGRNGFQQSKISLCCLGKRNKHKNFKWKYIDE